ncbi:MAG TPA: YjfB family protein [Armatimonadota bacterium]|jgi:hypothetical protein
MVGKVQGMDLATVLKAAGITGPSAPGGAAEQVQVSVLKKALDTEGAAVTQLIQSVGVGTQIDTKA